MTPRRRKSRRARRARQREDRRRRCRVAAVVRAWYSGKSINAVVIGVDRKPKSGTMLSTIQDWEWASAALVGSQRSGKTRRLVDAVVRAVRAAKRHGGTPRMILRNGTTIKLFSAQKAVLNDD